VEVGEYLCLIASLIVFTLKNAIEIILLYCKYDF
jgi:hypothetical protein